MTYTLNYRNSFDEIKSMNTATNIDLVLSKDGLPFDLTNITDNVITIKIANQDGYIKDLPVDVSDYTDEEKASGTFTLYLDDDFMKTFPPDIYYLEVWVNTPNNNRIIFPSNDDILPFTVNSNLVNGSNAIPMVTFYQVKQDIESTKQLVLEHEAKIEKYINSLNGKKDDVINDIDSKIQNYYKFSNNIKATLNSLNSKVFNESNNLNGKIDDISSNVSAVTNAVNNAGTNVKNSVEDIISSARSNINHSINTNSAINLINSGAANADSHITNIVSSAKDKLVANTNDLKNEITNLTQNGTKQINVAAGSAAAHLTNVARDTVNSGTNAMSTINSTTSSATNNMDNYTSSFDSHIITTTNSLNNYFNDTNYSYSNLNDRITDLTHTISNSANSAYSYMNDVRDNNTSQMVSSAVSKFNKSTGTNNTIPKSLESLSEIVSSNYSVADSYRDVSNNKFSNHTSLINTVSSIAVNNSNSVKDLNNSTNVVSQSVSYLSSMASSTESSISSLSLNCSNYLTTAKSYTDEKIQHLPKNNNSSNSVMNLVPIQFTGKLEITEGDEYGHGSTITDMRQLLDFDSLTPGTYWLSCHVIKGGATYISEFDNDYPIDGDTSDDHSWYGGRNIGSLYKTGQDCKYKLVLDKDPGDITFGIGNNDNKDPNGSMNCTVTNFCMTKSDDFVPFSKAENNVEMSLGNDINKPNLIVKPSFEDTVTTKDYRVFNIPVIKGKTYWMSCHIDKAELSINDDEARIKFFSSWGHDGELDAKGNFGYGHFSEHNSTLTNGGPFSRLSCYWTADRTGNLPIGISISTEFLAMKTDLKISEFCVTETDNFIPYRIAQSNRENIQAVFNTILNSKDSNTSK